MQHPEFYAASFAIIKNNEGKILFQKRENTGFRDGYWQLPSGHIEGEETMIDTIIREMKEELNIDIIENNCKIVHMSHCVKPGERTYFNCYIAISGYSGELKNLEENKCSEIQFFSIDEIKSAELFAYDWYILEKIISGESFSERII